MKRNINELEFEFLNNKPKNNILTIIGTIIYYTLKVILEAVYIITCIICKTIEIITWILTIGTAYKVTCRRYKRRH